MISSNLKKHAGWWLLLLSASTYGIGIYLTGRFLCQSVGPNVLLLGVAIGAISCMVLLREAFARKSLLLGAASVGVALLVLVLAFASVGLTLPGCGGV